MREADAVILVVDATVGVTEEDANVAEWLRRAKRPVLLVANKVDSESGAGTSGRSCRSAWASRSR